MIFIINQDNIILTNCLNEKYIIFILLYYCLDYMNKKNNISLYFLNF